MFYWGKSQDPGLKVPYVFPSLLRVKAICWFPPFQQRNKVNKTEGSSRNQWIERLLLLLHRQDPALSLLLDEPYTPPSSTAPVAGSQNIQILRDAVEKERKKEARPPTSLTVVIKNPSYSHSVMADFFILLIIMEEDMIMHIKQSLARRL